MIEIATLKRKRRARICNCGCQKKFTPKRANQTFFDASHRKNYWSSMVDRHIAEEYRFFLANRDLIRRILSDKLAAERWLKRREKHEK